MGALLSSYGKPPLFHEFRQTHFAASAAVIVPLPVPDELTVHHAASLDTDQDELDVTVKVVAPADAATFLFEGVTVSVGADAVAVKEPAIPGA